MTDYRTDQGRPNITPTPLPPYPTPGTPPVNSGWGLTPVLGTVAVIGIVALVAWGVIQNGPDADGDVTAPVAAPAATQTAPAPAATPDAPVTPAPMVEPEPTPQEVPVPAPEAAPAPTPTPAPAPSN